MWLLANSIARSCRACPDGYLNGCTYGASVKGFSLNRAWFCSSVEITQHRRFRSFWQVAHSSDTRTSHATFAVLRYRFSHSAASVWQRAFPQSTWSVLGFHEPGLLVGRPCMKQYISQVSAPRRSALRTAFNHSSLVRLLWVSSNVFHMLSSFCCQNILNIFCSPTEKPFR